VFGTLVAAVGALAALGALYYAHLTARDYRAAGERAVLREMADLVEAAGKPQPDGAVRALTLGRLRVLMALTDSRDLITVRALAEQSASARQSEAAAMAAAAIREVEAAARALTGGNGRPDPMRLMRGH
jgi:hypothetical protein